MIHNKIIYGDCRQSLKELHAQNVKVQMCVTSPPYYGLRNYGDESNQIGQEDTPEKYIQEMVDVFVEEGKHETIVLNYQSLDEDVIDYNKRFQVGTWTGFSLFFFTLWSVYFKMSFWCHRFDQKTNEIFLRILALGVKSKK